MSYTVPPDPLGVNISFTSVPALVSQFSELNSAANNVAAELNVAGHINGLPRLKTVVGWTSKDFSTAGVNAFTHLMNSPKLPEPTSVALAGSQGTVILPAGAVLHAVQVVAEVALQGAATDLFDIGTVDNTTLAGPNNGNLLKGTTQAKINAGVMALGDSGTNSLSSPGTSGPTVPQFVLVSPKTTGNTGGRLKIAVTYWDCPTLAEDLVGNTV